MSRCLAPHSCEPLSTLASISPGHWTHLNRQQPHNPVPSPLLLTLKLEEMERTYLRFLSAPPGNTSAGTQRELPQGHRKPRPTPEASPGRKLCCGPAQGNVPEPLACRGMWNQLQQEVPTRQKRRTSLGTGLWVQRTWERSGPSPEENSILSS